MPEAAQRNFGVAACVVQRPFLDVAAAAARRERTHCWMKFLLEDQAVAPVVGCARVVRTLQQVTIIVGGHVGEGNVPDRYDSFKSQVKFQGNSKRESS